ncbi:hypothetical protein DFH27DRAFT_561559 [Peziza echinospora]|nr:hypothetical protein DFH27DRAFT_561559 [Peziza echinospora]
MTFFFCFPLPLRIGLSLSFLSFFLFWFGLLFLIIFFYVYFTSRILHIIRIHPFLLMTHQGISITRTYVIYTWYTLSLKLSRYM